jgi:phage terminase small subunit
MTPKQRKFADEYLIDLNATRAYKAAYPKVKTDEAARANGSRLLTNANVQSYVEQQLNEISSAKLADAKEVMEYLTSVLRGESSSEIVVIENIGDYMSEARTMSKAPDEKERLKAAELLGKRYGLFTDKLKVDCVVPIVIRDDLPEDDE